MWSIRDSLPRPFWGRLQEELGREETLRLLWPILIGPHLAANTRFRSLRNGRLLIGVEERTWRSSLTSLEGIVRATINRFWGEDLVGQIEFVEDPPLKVPRREAVPTRSIRAQALQSGEESDRRNSRARTASGDRRDGKNPRLREREKN